MRAGGVCLLAALIVPAGVSAQEVPHVVAPVPVGPDATRAQLLEEARVAKKDTVHPPQPSGLEKWTSRIEPFVMTSPLAGISFRRGPYLKFGGVAPGGGWAIGPGYRYEGLAGGAIDADVSARGSLKRYWELHGQVSAPRIHDGRAGVALFARLRDMPQEDFYGFGPNSERHDRVSFALRESTIGAGVDYRPATRVRIGASAESVRASTRGGTDKNFPSIEERFETAALTGFGGAQTYTVLRAGGAVDRARLRGYPPRGLSVEIDIARWAARAATQSSFTAVTADARQYVPFFNDTRLIAIRAALWHTVPEATGDVPLYYQPTLGGPHALRGYREFRFRDRTAVAIQAEYRFALMDAAEGVVFYEAGTVGPSLDALGRLKTDYGLGVRLGSPDGIAVRLEAAFGTPETPRFLVKLGHAF